MLETTQPIEAPITTPAPELEKPKAPTPDELKEDPSKARLLHMAKQEKALRKQSQAIKAKEDAIKVRESELQSLVGWKERLTKDPLTVLQEAGITYDTLASLLVGNPQDPKDMALKQLEQKISSMESGQSKIQQLLQDNEKKQMEQASKQINNEILRLTKSDPDGYEMIDKHSAHEQVFELMRWTFENEGYLPSVEECAKEVEEYLVEHTLNLTQAKKIQNKLRPPTAPVPVELPPAPNNGPRPIPRMPTLTHQTVPATTTTHKLSDKQRRERAILAAMGKLNN